MNLKRRDFFKVLSATVCGTVISILGLSRIKKQDSTVSDKTKKQEREQMIMSFSPGEIVSSVVHRERFFICTRHSLWEVEEGPYGNLQRKLIRYT